MYLQPENRQAGAYPGPLGTAPGAGQIEAGPVGQAQVEDQGVVRIESKLRERLRNGAGGVHRVSRVAETPDEGVLRSPQAPGGEGVAR